MSTNLQKYFDQATEVLNAFGISLKEGEESRLATLLQEAVTVDEPKVVAIARTVRYLGTFNELVRDNISDMKVADRYQDIKNMFESVREDSKLLVKQLQDGKIDTKEKLTNLWMKLARGTPHRRFEKIREKYLSVTDDTKGNIEKETRILNGYMDFGFALKEAEGLAHNVLKTQTDVLEKARSSYSDAVNKVSEYKGADKEELSGFELARDQALRAFKDEENRYQLLKDVAENLTVGYNVGETLVAKLRQTHDIKKQLYTQAVTFFTTNEHVFTFMDALYTSEHSLHEQTQAIEAMKQGANKGLEDIAEFSGDLEKAALKTAYGSTIDASSVQKLVDAIIRFEEESTKMIGEYRTQSTKNSEEVSRIVNEGKQKYRVAVEKYAQVKAGTQ